MSMSIERTSILHIPSVLSFHQGQVHGTLHSRFARVCSVRSHQRQSFSPSRQSCRTIDSDCGHVATKRRVGVRAFSDLANGPFVATFAMQADCPNDEELTKTMQAKRKTMILTGAGQGIGVGVTPSHARLLAKY